MRISVYREELWVSSLNPRSKVVATLQDVVPSIGGSVSPLACAHTLHDSITNGVDM